MGLGRSGRANPPVHRGCSWIPFIHRSPAGSGLNLRARPMVGGMKREDCAKRDREQAAAAAARLTIGGAIGLAIRDHRRRLGMSQRAYAAMRKLAPTLIARAETRAGRFLVDDVVEVLAGTGFGLALVQYGEAEDGSVSAAIVDPSTWGMTDLIARVRDGSRRFPAHHETHPDTVPPWWWHREFFVGKGPEPYWFAPRPTPSGPYRRRSQDDGRADAA